MFAPNNLAFTVIITPPSQNMVKTSTNKVDFCGFSNARVLILQYLYTLREVYIVQEVPINPLDLLIFIYNLVNVLLYHRLLNTDLAHV